MEYPRSSDNNTALEPTTEVQPEVLAFQEGPVQETPPVLGPQSGGRQDYRGVGGYRDGRGAVLRQIMNADTETDLA